MSEHDEHREQDEHAEQEQPWPATRGGRPDPRLRPPDPAGTQPKFNPADLLPTRMRGSLWAEHPIDSDVVEERLRQRTAPPHGGAGGGGGGALARRPAAVTPAAAPAERYSRFAPRFQFLTGALLAVAAAAIVLAVLIIVDDGNKGAGTAAAGGEQWSSWKPVSNGTDGPTQIAEHVAGEYRLPDKRQLVAVTASPMEIAGLPVTVAVRESAAQGGDIKLVEGVGVLYRMCGLGGGDCAIEGTPSQSRALLLRREALELALYSFRYLGVDQTVVFLPPVVSADPKATTDTPLKVALLFRRQDSDISALVARPLRTSLTQQTPTVATVRRSPDTALVSSVTGAKQFQFSFEQSNQDARAFLVLDPLP